MKEERSIVGPQSMVLWHLSLGLSWAEHCGGWVHDGTKLLIFWKPEAERENRRVRNWGQGRSRRNAPKNPFSSMRYNALSCHQLPKVHRVTHMLMGWWTNPLETAEPPWPNHFPQIHLWRGLYKKPSPPHEPLEVHSDQTITTTVKIKHWRILPLCVVDFEHPS